MIKSLCSLLYTWMTISDCQFYAIDSLFCEFLEAWNAKLVLRGLYIELTVRSEVFFLLCT